jgi:hypothetical protein
VHCCAARRAPAIWNGYLGISYLGISYLGIIQLQGSSSSCRAHHPGAGMEADREVLHHVDVEFPSSQTHDVEVEVEGDLQLAPTSRSAKAEERATLVDVDASSGGFEFAVGKKETNAGCTACSNVLCSPFGRVGNMVVLKETRLPNGDRRLDYVIGPYWPVTVFVTYPLIFGISGESSGTEGGWAYGSTGVREYGSTGVREQLLFDAQPPPPPPFPPPPPPPPLPPGSIGTMILPLHHWAFTVVFVVLVLQVVVSLFRTATSDPGILKRTREKPADSNWVYSDITLTYRPVGAIYCSDCNCTVLQYDHLCRKCAGPSRRASRPARARTAPARPPTMRAICAAHATHSASPGFTSASPPLRAAPRRPPPARFPFSLLLLASPPRFSSSLLLLASPSRFSFSLLLLPRAGPPTHRPASHPPLPPAAWTGTAIGALNMKHFKVRSGATPPKAHELTLTPTTSTSTSSPSSAASSRSWPLSWSSWCPGSTTCAHPLSDRASGRRLWAPPDTGDWHGGRGMRWHAPPLPPAAVYSEC